MAEVLVDYFATIADGIGGNSAQLKSMDDFKNHPSVQRIKQESENLSLTPNVKPVTQGQVLAALESLNTKKATGCDGIPAKVMKIGAKELSQPLTDLFNSCTTVYGQVTGSVGIGLLFTKRMISILKKISGP